VSGFDHVAVPMQNTAAMVAFYRRLGFQMTENENAVSVYIGSQMINFHRPTRWQDPSFTLRAPAAKPSMWRLLLRVGWDSRLVEGDAGQGRSEDRARAGRPSGRASEDRFEHLHSRS
jgi:catechol 2,3-dioxygenase-like lactoylglutathione lyase family enzyme